MPTLEEVETAFREWRTLKKKKWERTPDELMSMARGLVVEHPVGTVAFRLGIRAEKLEAGQDSAILAGEEKFVEVPGVEIMPPPEPTVTVRVRPGKKNEIAISVPTGSVNWQELLKGLSKI